MATIAPQVAKNVGTPVTFAAAAAGGDSAAPNPLGVFLVRNGGGSSINVTMVVPGNTEFAQAQPDVVAAVAAGVTVAFTLSQSAADPADGLIDFTYSAVTSVTVANVALG